MDGCSSRGVEQDHLQRLLDPAIESIDERMPTLHGVVRLEMCKSVFGVPTLLDTTLPWFDADGRPNFKRHELNDREQLQTLKTQVENILQWGLSGDSRGVPMAQLSEGEVPPCRLFAGAHLATAFYMALEKNPRNVDVVAGLKKGLARVQVFTFKTPKGVILWLKDFMNFDWNQKQSITFLESMEHSRIVQVDWEAYLEGNVAATRDSTESLRQRTWAFINKTFPDLIKRRVIVSMNYFEQCRFCNNTFADFEKDLDLWANFRKWALAEVVFGNASISNESIVSVMKQIFATFLDIKSGKTSDRGFKLSNEDFGLWLLEAVKFAAPTGSNPTAQMGEDAASAATLRIGLNHDATNVEWLLTKTADATDRLKAMSIDILDGRLYKEVQKKADKLKDVQVTAPAGGSAAGASAAGGACASAEATATSTSTARRGRGPGNAASKAVKIEHIECVRALNDAKTNGTHLTWFEDVCEAMAAFVDETVGCSLFTDKQRTSTETKTLVLQAKRFFMRVVLTFAFSADGTVLFNGKVYSGWSTLRPDLKKFAARMITQGRPIPAAIDAIASSSSAACVAQDRLLEKLNADGAHDHFVEFIGSNDASGEARDLPCVSDLATDAWAKFTKDFPKPKPTRGRSQTVAVSVKLEKLVETAAVVVGNAPELDDEWLKPSKQVGLAWADPPSYPNFRAPREFADVIPDVAVLRGYLSLRSRCMMEVIAGLISRSLAAHYTLQTQSNVDVSKAVGGIVAAVLKEEACEQDDESAIQQLDVRIIGCGYCTWRQCWSLLVESMVANVTGAAAESGDVPSKESLDAELTDIITTVQKVLGLERATDEAQASFDEEMAKLDQGGQASGAGETTLALVPADGGSSAAASADGAAVSLGTLGELVSFQDRHAIDASLLVGSHLRRAMDTKHSFLNGMEYVFRVPSREITAPYIKQLCLAIQAETYNLAFLPNDIAFSTAEVSAAPAGAAGTRATAAAVALTASKGLKADEFKLYFTGEIEAVRPNPKQKASSFHILTVSGTNKDDDGADVDGSLQVPLYMNMYEERHGIQSDCPVPAWLIPVPSAAKGKGKGKGKGRGKAKEKETEAAAAMQSESEPKSPLEVVFHVVTLALPRKLCVGDATEVQFRCPVAVPSEVGLAMAPPIQLTRDLVDGERALEKQLLSNPKVAEAMREAGESALGDPRVQQAIMEQAQKQLTKENAAAVAQKVKEWAGDPEVQAKARHFAGMAMEGAGQVGQKFVGCIEQGPAGVQLLAFVAGASSCTLAVLNLINIANLQNPVAYLVSVYLFAFALSTMLFEAKPEWIEKLGGPLNGYQDLLLEYCKFFAFSGGRGMFYIFQGSLWLCGASLTTLLQLVVGCSLVFVGILHALMHFGIMPQDVALKMKTAVRKGDYEQVSGS